MSDFSADYMIQNKIIWQDLVACKKVEKDIHWSKIVIHGVPVESFSTSDELHLLKEEIETFNSQLKLMKNPAWIFSERNRQTKRHASIVVAVENTRQADYALRDKLCIAGL